jgi:serine/threonine protein phosphatase 1
VPRDSEKFARLGQPRHVWAIGAIHGELDRLAALHDHVGDRFRPGDRLVYLGNIIGHATAIRPLIAEILAFRRGLIARPGMLAEDVVFLRGAQEEMWQKLLQLQFAPNPQDVLRWMLAQGVAGTLAGYGGHVEDGMAAAREGAMRLTRWTNALRDAIRLADGHTAFYSALRRAAFTADTLFVSAGIDTSRPLAAQGDAFWWAAAGFDAIADPFDGFARLVRGHDPAGAGVRNGPVAVTLDGGAGRGGTIAAGLFAPGGVLMELFEV